MLGLTKSRAVLRAFKDLAIEVNSSFKPRRMVWSFPNAGIRGKIEATSLRQLLKLVLVHFYSDSVSAPPHTSPQLTNLPPPPLLQKSFTQKPKTLGQIRSAAICQKNQNHRRRIPPSSVTEMKIRQDQRFSRVFSPSLPERERRERERALRLS